MISNAEKVGSTSESLRASQDRHPLEDVPPFDPDAAARRVEEARQISANKPEIGISDFEGENVWGGSDGDYDSYGDIIPPAKLEGSSIRLQKYDRILSNPNLLKTAQENYLGQYQPNSKSRADVLSSKDMLDHYIIGRLSGDSARDFVNSEQFRNYASYIVDTARQKVQIINGKKYYPELSTNPVLKNPRYRRLVISQLQPADQVDRIVRNLGESEAMYKSYLRTIEGRLENRALVSQGELNMVGDYLYSGRDFGSGLAKKFACYMFNEARERRDLEPSTQIGGALANYFGYKDTLDDRLKDRRIIIANNSRYDNEKQKLTPVNIGVSCAEYCVLEQNKINRMSLSSDEGLSKSRRETISDLYSLMMVSFHELTHDYQKFMVADGKDNSSAMGHILNQVLRKNKNQCFPLVDKNLNKVLDKNGNEVKTDYYRANHDSDEIEVQADEEAWRQCERFIIEHEVQYYYGKKDKAGKMRASDHWLKCDKNEQEVRTRRAFTLKVDENGQEMPYIQYDIEQLGKSIKGDPNIIKQYPQLSEFFDKSGFIKPDIFFNKRIASVDMHGHDIITDDFGVEIATYALMDSSNVKNILSYIQNPNNNLTEAQVMRCVTNLWNVLHQDALKTRPLRKTNFENYSDTRARGKLTNIGDLKESYLKQYLHQLFNCTHIAEVLKDKYPQVGAEIEHQEQTYFISYYDELARDVNLPAEYSDKVKNYYLRTKNKALQQIAMKL